MRVTLVLHDRLDPNAGGGGTVLGLGDQLGVDGLQVEYCSFDLLPARLSHNTKTMLWPAYLAWRLRRTMRGNPQDVIDASLGDAWLWQRTDPRGSRQAVTVARSHGLIHLAHQAELAEVEAGRKRLSWRYPLYWGGFRIWEVARTLKQADVALFLNPLECDYAIEQLGIEPSRARIVPNGIPDSFLEAPMAAAQLEEDAPVRIAQVGGWRYLKGINNSVEAMTEILSRHPNVTMTFAGTGASAEEISARFPARLRERVEVVPAFDRARLPEILSGHHIHLFPSLAEGFGLGLVEAMACGLAPVTTRVGGPATLVEDGKNGLLVPPGETPRIVDSLERLLADRQLLRTLQEGARESARPFAQSRVASQTREIYEEALARRAGEGARR
jgi:glycosyltransferase involved in cell wall biosynthesis